MVTDYGLVDEFMCDPVCVCVGWKEVVPNWLAVKAFNEESAAGSPISWAGVIGDEEDGSSKEGEEIERGEQNR